MKKFRPYPCRTNDAILMVTAYQAGALEGLVVHPKLGTPQHVANVPQFLFLLDHLLSQEEALISAQAFEPTQYTDVTRIATLRVQVLFREHSTWQGRVLWEEQQLEATFLSVLELVQILDEILSD